ncbi:pentapeptide repeat-containing protein [Streptomyces sp. NPDC021096]|uniref:pentapeptide repeat-containing protein n=1 Tax=Streptomyces sp. NPDC021096 TaxID=3154792 RepID=UPI003409D2E0
MASALPGLAALVALLFTWMQVNQNSKEVRVAEQSAITNRYNAAVTNLGSSSAHIRLGGIYALERIMRDSPRDEPAVLSVLSEYLRDGIRAAPREGKEKKPKHSTEMDAAVSVMGDRPDSSTVGGLVNLPGLDLRGLGDVQSLRDDGIVNFKKARFDSVNLQGTSLGSFSLREASMIDSRLDSASIISSDLTEADLQGSSMTDLFCSGSDLTRARLGSAKLTNADFSFGDPELSGECILTGVDFTSADMIEANLNHLNLEEANLAGANLTQANFSSAQMRHSILSSVDTDGETKVSGANFYKVDLRDADLRGIDFSGSDLRGADLRGAQLDGARLEGAELDGARGVPAGHA